MSPRGLLALIGQWPAAAGLPMLRGDKVADAVMACRAEAKNGDAHLTAPDFRTPAPAKSSPLMRLWLQLELWKRRMDDRRLLARMDERMLKDMGISSVDASNEADKPFWLK